MGIWGGSILGVDWRVSVCVSVFGCGALMYVCGGAGDLWGVSVFVGVGGVSGVRMWVYLGADGRVDIVCA